MLEGLGNDRGFRSCNKSFGSLCRDMVLRLEVVAGS